nr:linker for activation of T-cells family member 2 isoform X1 [Cavia porcellus]
MPNCQRVRDPLARAPVCPSRRTPPRAQWPWPGYLMPSGWRHDVQVGTLRTWATRLSCYGRGLRCCCCYWGLWPGCVCAAPAQGQRGRRKSMSREICKRISRASQWLLGPIPWSGRRGQDPEWTWPLTRPQQGRTNCCGSPPCRTVSVGDLVGKGQAVGWPVRSAEGTTQAFLPEPEFARYQNFSKETPLSWSITTGGAPGSPPKMRTTPTPMRTCSSVGHGAGTQSQVERTPRTIRTQYPSTNGTSPCRLRSKSPEQHICPQRGARMRTRESQTT